MINKTNSIPPPLKNAACLGFALALSFAANESHAADYYRWTDANGVVHMTDKKPENREVEVIKSRAPAPKLLSEQKKEAEDAATEKAEALAAEQKAPQAADLNTPKELRCQQEKERLNILKNNKVVHMQDANGNLKTLTEAQIEKEIANTQKAIDLLCN